MQHVLNHLGDHALVPVPEHVRLPDLRPVQRAAPEARSGSPVADRASSGRAVRLRAGSQRPSPGDRGRSSRPRNRSPPGSRRTAGARIRTGCTRPTRTGSGPQVKTIGVLHPGGASKGGGGDQDQGRLQAGDPSGRAVGAGSPGMASGRSGRDRASPRTTTRTPRHRSRSATSRTARTGGSAGAARRATARPTRSRSSCSRRVASTATPAPPIRTRPRRRRPDSIVRRRHPATCRTSRPGRRTSTSMPARRQTMARLLQGGSPGRPWPDFATLGLSANPSLGHGPGYRGRLTHPSILVLADQESHDDLFTGRALTGNVGQHLQAFLRSAGVTKQYAILRTLPVDSLGDPVAAVTRAVDDPATRSILREVMRLAQPECDRHARPARRAGRRRRGAARYAGGPPRAVRRARTRPRRGKPGLDALDRARLPTRRTQGSLPRWP